MKTLAIAHLTACALALAYSCSDVAPEVAYSLEVRSPSLEPELARALRGWETIGLFRAPVGESDVGPFFVELAPRASLPSDGVANPNTKQIFIGDNLSGRRLLVILAHEVGHLLLDTPEHTRCGIMGASDTLPCSEDIALACERFPALEVCP